MPLSETSRDAAIRRLDEQADALAARTAHTPPDYSSKAAGYGARLVALLFGGAFVGVGFGAVFDAFAKTAPWGMVAGVLGGFTLSIWLAVRTAQRMSAEAAREWGPVQDLPLDDEDD